MDLTRLEQGSRDSWMVRRQLPGRVRLKQWHLEGDPALARAIEAAIGYLPGVKQVEANPTSGSVLLLYDEKEQSVSSLLSTLQQVRPIPVPLSSGKPARQEQSQDDSWLTRTARGFKDLTRSVDGRLKESTGGKTELRQLVLSFLFLRAGAIGLESGAVSWSTIQGVVEFIVAWTLYQHPGAEQELKEAKDTASPSP